MSETKRTILITGAGGHIGSGFVSHYLNAGMRVIAVSSRTTFEQSENLSVIAADFTKVGAGRLVIEQAAEIHGEIDFIINNAARQDVAFLKNADPAKVQEIFHVNVTAIAEMYMQLAKNKYGLESVLNISSIEATTARPEHLIYGASKAALESLTRSVAVELAPIRSNALRLGLIERKGIREAWPTGVQSWEKTAPLARLGTLKDVLRAADYLLTATWLTGSILTLDGGISAATNW